MRASSIIVADPPGQPGAQLRVGLERMGRLYGVELDISRPAKRTDNAFAESLKGRFREDCLNAYWFVSRTMHC
jgi:hypothetical protein